MRTIDEGTGGQGDARAEHADDAPGRAPRAGTTTIPTPTRAGRATRAGMPTLHLPHTGSAPAPRAGAGASVPSQASTGVAELLRGPVRQARVLLSVPAAVYLTVQTPQGPDVVGVLTSDAARLPLSCVLFRPSNGRPLVAVPSGAPAQVGGGRLVVGDLVVSAAAWWDPRPKLPTARPALLPEGVRQLRVALYGEGVPHSAFALPGLPGGPSGPLAALRGAVRRADLDAALRTATRLVGLGPGLTPAGDDVLAGTTAGLVLLGHPAAERFGAGVTGLAAGRTTELSRALLRHAAAGRVSGEFAAVLRGLVGDGALAPAISALLATGSTSGRALALGLCTAIDLVDRTARPR
ncbi:DUF2877 domain-containing protein [Modestobacter italicus]|uniref:DUF2877 domain-containing protein n=1 Tax=Modestobacter italicus (strain DSM 44449 / CECT 9708 / BC 501) TaxID=2732864 RepID=UPI001C9560FE|nr:DUF2877 domain-containing protein [Modestobacter italicus]